MIKNFLAKRFSKQTLIKKFQVERSKQDVERILHLILHEMGYRTVTANQWEIASPSALGLYRQKWIPERFIDIHFESHQDDSTRVEICMSYFLTKRRFKYKIESLLDSELEIIKEVIMHGKVDGAMREDILIKSLEKESEFANIFILLLLITISLSLVIFILFIPGIAKWIVLSAYILILSALLYWFHLQNNR